MISHYDSYGFNLVSISSFLSHVCFLLLCMLALFEFNCYDEQNVPSNDNHDVYLKCYLAQSQDRTASNYAKNDFQGCLSTIDFYWDYMVINSLPFGLLIFKFLAISVFVSGSSICMAYFRSTDHLVKNSFLYFCDFFNKLHFHL